jgi:hypothetical protein
MVAKIIQSLAPVLWPVLVAVVLWSFRKELRGLFKSGFKAFNVEVPPQPEVKQETVTVALEGVGATAVIGNVVPAVTDSSSAPPGPLKASGPVSVNEWDLPVATDDPELNRRAADFQKAAPGPVTPETKRNMAVAIARVFLDLQCERIYRGIYGSQLEALLLTNRPGGASDKELKEVLERFKETAAANPFESWLGFLTKTTKLVEEVPSETPFGLGTRYRSTDMGRTFLQYLVRMGLTGPKPF